MWQGLLGAIVALGSLYYITKKREEPRRVYSSRDNVVSAAKDIANDIATVYKATPVGPREKVSGIVDAEKMTAAFIYTNDGVTGILYKDFDAVGEVLISDYPDVPLLTRNRKVYDMFKKRAVLQESLR